MTRSKTICLHGVESTGKSWLAEKLGQHFNTNYVPEYGRTYTETHAPDPWTADDLRAIVRGHDAAVAAALPQANKLLFLDTDAIMTAVWAEMLLGECPPDLALVAPLADHYLLMDNDTPFTPDAVRLYGDPAVRQNFHEKCRAALVSRGADFTLISGSWDARFAQAINACASLTT